MRALALAAALLLGACNQNSPQRIYEGPDVDAIRAAETELNAAIEHRSEAEAVARYETGALILDYLRVAEQRVGVDRSYRQLFEDRGSALNYGYANVEVARSRDLAESDGECFITRTSPTTSRAVTYAADCMKIWRRGEDNHWRITRELRGVIHNLDEPINAE